jgi:hypothetical protein
VGSWRASFLFIAASHQWARTDARMLISSYLIPAYLVDYMQTNIHDYRRNYHQILNRQLIQYLNKGHLVTAFFGHGGGAVWEVGPTSARGGFQRHLFDQSHVRRLTNTTKPTVVFALTCYTNDFDSPYIPEVLGESFVIAPGGAIAVIGANDRSYTHMNRLYLDKFMTLMKEHRLGRLGDLFLQAKLDMDNEVANEQYQLLGDPSLKFSLPLEDIVLEQPRWIEASPQNLEFDYTLPEGTPLPAALHCYVLDSSDHIIVEWEEQVQVAEGTISHEFKRTGYRGSLRIVVYLGKGERGDHVGGIYWSQ